MHDYTGSRLTSPKTAIFCRHTTKVCSKNVCTYVCVSKEYEFSFVSTDLHMTMRIKISLKTQGNNFPANLRMAIELSSFRYNFQRKKLIQLGAQPSVPLKSESVRFGIFYINRKINGIWYSTFTKIQLISSEICIGTKKESNQRKYIVYMFNSNVMWFLCSLVELASLKDKYKQGLSRFTTASFREGKEKS